MSSQTHGCVQATLALTTFAAFLLNGCGEDPAAEEDVATCQDGALASGMVELGPSGFELDRRVLVPDGVNSYPLLQLVGESHRFTPTTR